LACQSGFAIGILKTLKKINQEILLTDHLF
jgi:hypothetical protein